MSSEKEKMLSGKLYDPNDAELIAARRYARDLLTQLNNGKKRQEEGIFFYSVRFCWYRFTNRASLLLRLRCKYLHWRSCFL